MEGKKAVFPFANVFVQQNFIRKVPHKTKQFFPRCENSFSSSDRYSVTWETTVATNTAIGLRQSVNLREQ